MPWTRVPRCVGLAPPDADGLANAVIIPVRNVVCTSTWLTWRSAADCSPIAAVATTPSE
jgi:hypothetical protein